MTTKLNYNGDWKAPDGVYIKSDGVWKSADNIYIKDDGVWKEVYTAFSASSIYGPKTFNSTRASYLFGALYVKVVIPGSEITGNTTQNYVDITGYSNYSLSNMTINGVAVTFGGSSTINVTAGPSISSDIINVTLTAGNPITIQFDAQEHPIFVYPGYAFYEYSFQHDSDIPWDWRYRGAYGSVIESILGQ